MVSQIKCPNCGIYNTNVDYCTNCNTLLSSKLRRELQFAAQEKVRKEKRNLEEEKAVSWIERFSKHRFLIVRVLAKTVRSIWLAFVAVGVFIAWLVSAIAA
ncbi:hypothetical protein [Psychroserpens burtonensis]|uniref:hypothetical protein n=1 Tax=Psychroserpens burtonensis TaxID=49278 RepID=UPI0003F59DE6|nr:hypothetical protein [Psychroserpens burtonensis]